ncbi:tail fiber assembly protein [Salidesulfovibrio brasiliensis]|uniref:tail fiber assembly protein n=1 Tax=Salidesulfovibrio brasiliensis TaxID=221711 RepID=UPI0009FB0689|nr:tail fiber assembly protein [Salidesulfovibrio brasiliensis]
MWRFPDGSFRANPPKQIVMGGVVRSFADLTREELDAQGYNEAVALRREPYTTYETTWGKGEDLIYRETVVSAVVDEAARLDAEAVTVRKERDERLRLSDWTQLADAPLDDAQKTAWADYRQALRDVPQQTGFPDVVEWPEAV